jgi:hypothetical protein
MWNPRGKVEKIKKTNVYCKMGFQVNPPLIFAVTQSLLFFGGWVVLGWNSGLHIYALLPEL